MSILKNKDFISIDDFSKNEIIKILDTAVEMQNTETLYLAGKILGSLFFEPSTRTRLSFESAMTKLGGSTIGFSDPKETSFSKGETLWDTIKMVDKYADIIVIRHSLDGAARLAAFASKIPVINAGDGSNQHPTQTLIDLFAIRDSQGTLENLKIAVIGDLKYARTIHSLIKKISDFNPRIYFVSPPSLKIPSYIMEELQSKKVIYSEHKEINEVMDKVDIVYIPRIQKERFPDQAEYEKVKNIYIIKKSMLKNVKSNMKILSPLPRVNEIHHSVDDTLYAYYFEQAGFAIPVRKALLYMILK